MSENVLVVAAHPDDEILGCGGTIARHVLAGDKVAILIVAEGATSRDHRRNIDGRADELCALKEAAKRASSAIGVDDLLLAGLPDNRLDTLALLDVIKIVEDTVASTKPSILYTHHGGDLNIDHRVVHQAVMTACRPLPGAGTREIYSFETVSSTEFSSRGTGIAFDPTRYVDIAEHWAAKEAALQAYEIEMRAFPHARSIRAVRALAEWRGASVGIPMAEAFAVERIVLP